VLARADKVISWESRAQRAKGIAHSAETKRGRKLMSRNGIAFAPSAIRFAVSLVLVGAILFALCVSVDAQQPKKVFRIGYLSSADPARDSARYEAIRLALRERGYIEGHNIASEYRYAEGKLDRFSELAAELVRLKVDIIVVAAGARYVQAA
jgi:hypothetical protein